MTLTTPDDIARELDMSPRTVQLHCKRLGAPRISGRYLLEPDWAVRVRRSIAEARPGRPGAQR